VASRSFKLHWRSSLWFVFTSWTSSCVPLLPFASSAATHITQAAHANAEAKPAQMFHPDFWECIAAPPVVPNGDWALKPTR